MQTIILYYADRFHLYPTSIMLALLIELVEISFNDNDNTRIIRRIINEKFFIAKDHESTKDEAYSDYYNYYNY